MARAALGEALIQAAFDDWRVAPVSEPVRAALGLIVALSEHPETPPFAQVAHARAQGVSDAAIEQVIHICGAFHMIVRIADALGFEVPDVSPASGYGRAALARGYL
jgi:alkylhydroperoxidase family enzyme